MRNLVSAGLSVPLAENRNSREFSAEWSLLPERLKQVIFIAFETTLFFIQCIFSSYFSIFFLYGASDGIQNFSHSFAVKLCFQIFNFFLNKGYVHRLYLESHWLHLVCLIGQEVSPSQLLFSSFCWRNVYHELCKEFSLMLVPEEVGTVGPGGIRRRERREREKAVLAPVMSQWQSEFFFYIFPLHK